VPEYDIGQAIQEYVEKGESASKSSKGSYPWLSGYVVLVLIPLLAVTVISAMGQEACIGVKAAS
jgi:hypothetical protein